MPGPGRKVRTALRGALFVSVLVGRLDVPLRVHQVPVWAAFISASAAQGPMTDECCAEERCYHPRLSRPPFPQMNVRALSKFALQRGMGGGTCMPWLAMRCASAPLPLPACMPWQTAHDQNIAHPVSVFISVFMPCSQALCQARCQVCPLTHDNVWMSLPNVSCVHMDYLSIERSACCHPAWSVADMISRLSRHNDAMAGACVVGVM